MSRRVAAVIATAALLSCESPSIVPLQDTVDGRPPAALDWRTPVGDGLAIIDRIDVSRLDRVQRALLQRDLWMTFDIGIAQETRGPMRERIAPILRKLALPAEEIARLPDTYAGSVGQAGLPPDLFEPNGPWVLLGRENHPAASSHNRFFQWRSAFLILVRHPGGREATRKYVEALATDRYPPIPAGMEFANVRRALLISAEGEPVASPIVESVQVRRYGRDQEVFKFELLRPELRLRPLTKYEVRPSYAVSFEHFAGRQSLSVPVLSTCVNCHVGGGPASVQSFLNLMSMGLPLNSAEVGAQLQEVVRLKKSDRTWEELTRLWTAAR